MPLIKVFFTGGTIGSRVIDINNGVAEYLTNKPAKYRLLEHYKKARPNSNVEFSTEELFNVLSENMLFVHWSKICSCVYETSHADCDGVIITHGTDTLAYTASFLSFMLRHVDVPILLVSSNYPLEYDQANGFENFVAAVDFILKVGLRGVFVPIYCNNEVKFHLGSRLLQANPFTHCFTSISNLWFGRFVDSVFVRNDAAYNPTFEQLQLPDEIKVPLFYETKDIYCLSPYPGIDYSIISFDKKPCAILHGLYHSGTACTTKNSENRFSVVFFARKCIEDGIDFYASSFDSKHSVYSTSLEMSEAGVSFILNTSFEASYVKLLIAYSTLDNPEERQEFINKSIAFEQIL